MTGGAEVTSLAGEGQEIFVTAIFTFHASKAVVNITAIKIAVNHLLDIWPPEAILP